ncbi:hypothetical protein [Plantactinospora sp. DSM 117369]
MPNSGADLGADLYDLWRAGKDNLPSVAGEYATAADAVGNAASGMTRAFARPARFGGFYGPTFESWQNLRFDLEAILNETADNLRDTGEALCLAATEYSASDETARAEFNRLRQDNGEPGVDGLQ